jgi:hypothetical protein
MPGNRPPISRRSGCNGQQGAAGHSADTRDLMYAFIGHARTGRGDMVDRLDSEKSLREKQVELRERVDAIKRDFRGGLDRDFEEQAVQLENADVLNALLKQALTELEEIEQKLRRFEK